ncbi:hypothetical protein AA0120_g4799 [Alternaria tenuissima]|uniref:Uncharacterized protein n=1 Tax=Alternaria tenuissima TaxID=119927 RepID=A0A4Q4MJ56_9PLEO|nr:hypothetical protein AA0114_g4776 [Alternaria tenuissima]RYN92584.1 hypothetical protein AA0120_g4799 [Alternaria tenuissima]
MYWDTLGYWSVGHKGQWVVGKSTEKRLRVIAYASSMRRFEQNIYAVTQAYIAQIKAFQAIHMYLKL